MFDPAAVGNSPTADYHAAIAAESRWDAETPAQVLDAYARFLTQTLRPRGPVLDFGTGTGRFVQSLRAAGVDARGVEPSNVARAAGRERYGLDIAASLVGLPERHFSGVTAIEVIEHLPDPDWLRMVRDLLVPGGFLLVTTPNRDSVAARIGGRHWPQATNPFHTVLFNARALSGTLRRAGFVHPTLLRRGPVSGRTALHRTAHHLLLAAGLHSSLRMVAWTARTPGA